MPLFGLWILVVDTFAAEELLLGAIAAADIRLAMLEEAFPRGPDPERHVAAIRQYFDAGFMEFYRRELAPRLGL